mmetsp:Transcript_26649/g.45366  ORF Transcript_26649/g.45366 Transcript_26649/m.45366 type:complete len:156 (+) Transcript_26649:166-633(+)
MIELRGGLFTSQYVGMELTLGNVGDHTGYVLDNALSSCYMPKLQNLRSSLPIDKEKKKTAAARRFLCAEGEFECIRVGLVAAIRQGLLETTIKNHNILFNTYYDDDEIVVRVLPWMRFLEYITPNGSLGHTPCPHPLQGDGHLVNTYTIGLLFRL